MIAIGEIATFFWLIAWILLIARTSVLIAECFFDDGWARLKMVSGHTAGPCAERRPERSPEGPAVCPRVIFQFYHTSWKQCQDTQQKSRDTQPNPRYSAKNNVGMRMIAPFMPNKYWTNTYFFNSSYTKTIVSQFLKKKKQFIMDSEIANFIKSGGIHPTRLL